MNPDAFDKPPGRKELEFFLAQEIPAIRAQAAELIKKFKLPFTIQGNVLYEVGESTEAWLSRYVTTHKESLAMKEKIRKLAKIDDDQDQLFTVLVFGETGTGKEILAKAIHGARTTDFLAINCAGLPETLIESELFGHVEGAFTGSIKGGKEGIMKMAGTLFLDEVGELPMSAQAKLLRAIQSKTIRKVGSNKDEKIHCRIVGATHRNLGDMVEKKEFRLDLFARLSTFEIDTYSLMSRPDDIVPIIQSMPDGQKFVETMEKKLETNNGTIAHYLIHEKLLKFNVRSLQQHVKRFKVFGDLP
jgi:transcriptional regulator with PAS, ATPase and Fis domain